MVTKHPLKNKKVLITCGPTWVAIDNARVISNQSSGRMGHVLCDCFLQKGAKVTLLEGPVTHQRKKHPHRLIKYFFYDELRRKLSDLLRGHFDIIVHAAAVSDYTVQKTFRGKIASSKKSLMLRLKPTEKIINSIKKRKPQTFLVGFKLEQNISQTRQKAKKLIKDAGCDFVVVNAGTSKKYRGCVIDHNGKILSSASTRLTLAKNLIKHIEHYL